MTTEEQISIEDEITLTSCQEVGENTVTTVTTVTSQQNQQVRHDDKVTIGDDTEKIPLLLNHVKSIQNDDSDDNDDIFPAILGSAEADEPVWQKLRFKSEQDYLNMINS